MNLTSAAVASASDDETSPTATERAYRALKQLILDNELPAGTQLLELEVAARQRMGRTPVRDAMASLEQEGMVDLRSKHGKHVFVCQRPKGSG